jgi:hypothetical protein
MKLGQIVVLALAVASGTARADVMLDFEGVGLGCSVANYYNGGTDSCGNQGTNYGISVSGKVFADPNGNRYITGGSMNFAARNDINSLTFAGVGPDPYGDYAMYALNGNQPVNALWPAGVDAWIDENQQWHFGSVFDAVHDYSWGLAGLTLTGFSMSMLYLDNVVFHSATWQDPVDPVSLPLPGTLALLGVGALAMCRRKSV